MISEKSRFLDFKSRNTSVIKVGIAKNKKRFGYPKRFPKFYITDTN